MIKIAKIAEAMQKVLGQVADEAGKATGFIKRQVKVTGSNFAKTLVLGWLSNPTASLEELCQTALDVGLEITPQGLDLRFTKTAAACLKQVLEQAVEQVVISDPVAVPLLQRFNGIYLDDSSTVTLPDALSEIWKGCGCGSDKGNATVKLHVRYDYLRGQLVGLELSDGRTQDRTSALQAKPLPAGSVWLADLGYWKLAHLSAAQARGQYWLFRLHPQTAIFTADDKSWDLASLLSAQSGQEVELAVELGAKERLPARLFARRVPPQIAEQRRRRVREQAKRRGKTPSKNQLYLADWVVFVTNIPSELINLTEVFVLARVRWQIELLFKLWKSHLQIDTSRSQNPWRILCEFYGKLIGAVIQHWLLLVGCWQFPDRSFFKAAKTIQARVVLLTVSFHDVHLLTQALLKIQQNLQQGHKITKRKKSPATFQRLHSTQAPPLA